jgi:hypothetical protein
MMFPTISRRSLLTEMMTSRRTLYIEKKTSPSINVSCQPRRLSVLPYTYIHTRWPKLGEIRGSNGGFTYHSSRVVTHRILCSLSSIV